MTTTDGSATVEKTKKTLIDRIKAVSLKGRRLSRERNRRYKSDTSVDKEWKYLTRAPFDWRFANTVGVLGPRGSGKSTLLDQLFWHGRKSWASKKNRPIILPPIDCSALHKALATSPAAVILQRIRNWYLSQNRIDRQAEVGLRLERLISDYSKAGDQYLSLCSDLSETAEDYCAYVAEATRMRMNLQASLEQWLDEALEQFDATCFVIMLDDFDLTSDARIREWQRALMDELHQLRLIVVLTADFYRLDRLSSDTSEGLDDKTGRALLGKYLPPSNRLFVSRWRVTEAGVLDATDFSGTVEHFERLACETDLEPSLDVLRRLYPDRPRSIKNWSEATEELNKRREEKRPISSKDLLEKLSSSRGEILLARSIRRRGLENWVNILPWRKDVLSAEDWNEVVTSASARGAATHRVQKLQPLKSLFHKSNRNGIGQTNDDVHDLALGDATDDSREIWAELFADLSMHSPDTTETLDSKQNGYRNRVRVLQECEPLSSLGNAAQFSLEFNLDNESEREFIKTALSNQCRRRDFTLSLFSYWFDGRLNRRRNTLELEIGCPPLLSALAGNRDRWPLEIFQELGVFVDGRIRAVSEEELSDDDPSPSTEEVQDESGDAATKTGTTKIAKMPLEVLPRQLWALTLLVDGLHRAPWSAFAGVRNIELHYLVGLSGAFTFGAYFFALTRCDAIDRTYLTSMQRRLVDCINTRDAAHLVDELSVEAIRTFVAEFYSRPKGQKKSPNLNPPLMSHLKNDSARCLVDSAKKLAKLSILTDLAQVNW